jgi:hypothetical protein
LVKPVRQKKGAKEGEMYHHCSHRMMRLSITKMTDLPCTNQPSCGSNVSRVGKRRGWVQESSKRDRWKPRYGLHWPWLGVHVLAKRKVWKSEEEKAENSWQKVCIM